MVIGLGNPGAEYEETRHNAGFLVLDHLARRTGSFFEGSRLPDGYAGPGAFAWALWRELQALLVKPLTWMNRSGDVVAPLVHFDLLRIGQIYLMYRATLADGSRLGEAATRSESLEVAWFALDALRWDELAFDAVKFTLELLRADLERGQLALHFGSIEPLDPARSGPFGMNRLSDRWSLKLDRSV